MDNFVSTVRLPWWAGALPPPRTPAATNGWEIIGDIISDGASSMAAADAEGQDKTCPARSTPTKWVLVGHSMGTMAIELVRLLSLVDFLLLCHLSYCHLGTKNTAALRRQRNQSVPTKHTWRNRGGASLGSILASTGQVCGTDQ